MADLIVFNSKIVVKVAEMKMFIFLRMAATLIALLFLKL